MKKALAIISPDFIRLSADEVRIIDILRTNSADNQAKRSFLGNNLIQQHSTAEFDKLVRRAQEELDMRAAEELRSFNHDYFRYEQHQLMKAKVELWKWIETATKETFALLKPVAEKWQQHAEKVLAEYVETQTAAREMYAKMAAVVGVDVPCVDDPIEEKLRRFIGLCITLQREPHPSKKELEFIDYRPLVDSWLVEL